MPAIADVVVSCDGFPLATVTPSGTATLEPVYARKGEAFWRTAVNDDVGDIGRWSLNYNEKFPVKGSNTELVTRSLKYTIPTLKEAVETGSLGYVPAPALDYPTIVEIIVRSHPRSTEAQRDLAMSIALAPTATNKTLQDDLLVKNRAVY